MLWSEILGLRSYSRSTFVQYLVPVLREADSSPAVLPTGLAAYLGECLLWGQETNWGTGDGNPNRVFASGFGGVLGTRIRGWSLLPKEVAPKEGSGNTPTRLYELHKGWNLFLVETPTRDVESPLALDGSEAWQAHVIAVEVVMFEDGRGAGLEGGATRGYLVVTLRRPHWSTDAYEQESDRGGWTVGQVMDLNWALGSKMAQRHSQDDEKDRAGKYLSCKSWVVGPGAAKSPAGEDGDSEAWSWRLGWIGFIDALLASVASDCGMGALHWDVSAPTIPVVGLVVRHQPEFDGAEPEDHPGGGTAGVVGSEPTERFLGSRDALRVAQHLSEFLPQGAEPALDTTTGPAPESLSTLSERSAGDQLLYMTQRCAGVVTRTEPEGARSDWPGASGDGQQPGIYPLWNLPLEVRTTWKYPLLLALQQRRLLNELLGDVSSVEFPEHGVAGDEESLTVLNGMLGSLTDLELRFHFLQAYLRYRVVSHKSGMQEFYDMAFAQYRLESLYGDVNQTLDGLSRFLERQLARKQASISAKIQEAEEDRERRSRRLEGTAKVAGGVAAVLAVFIGVLSVNIRDITSGDGIPVATLALIVALGLLLSGGVGALILRRHHRSIDAGEAGASNRGKGTAQPPSDP